MKLSIIIPVYNVEATLGKCVASVLGQGVGDCEILLVDDGSTDGSAALADGWAEKDARITACHKPNGGLSSARNYGLERARGEYVTFVDSDDYVKENTYAILLETLDRHPEYDIIEYPVLQNPGTADERLFNPGTAEYADPLDWLAAYGLEHCWAWNKIYRRGLFATVRFPEGKTYEDVYAVAALVRLGPKIATTGNGLYYYRRNDAGIAADGTRNGLTALLAAQTALVAGLGIDTRQRRWHRLYLNMFTSQLYAYRATGKLTLKPQRIAPGRYAGGKDWLKALMLDTLGLRLSCKIFKLLTRK